MAVVTRQGKKFDPRTARMIDALTEKFGPFRIVQGSYNGGGVGASAGTHDKGGAIDVSDNGMSAAERDRFVIDAREIGWAMWRRPDLPGTWDSHFHGIAIQPGGKNDKGVLSSGAHGQVVDYYEGRNGLANDGRDPHAHLGVKPTTFEQYLAEQDAPVPQPIPEPKEFPDMFMYRTPDGNRAVLVDGGKQILLDPSTANALMKPITGEKPLYFQITMAVQKRFDKAYGVPAE